MNIINHNFDRECLPEFLKNNYLKDNINILEIGVFEGSYSLKIYQTFLNSSLYLLDTWKTNDNDFYYSVRPNTVENAFAVAKSRFENKDKVFFIIENSKIAHQKYNDNFFDWIYIDADHSYDAVKNDLQNWYPKLKNKGIMSGHDWDANPNMQEYNMFGVQKAITEFIGDKSIDLNLTNEKYHKSWFFVKEL